MAKRSIKPSLIIAAAPAPPSSAGWKITTASPAKFRVSAEFPQPVRHECCGAMNVVQQFGMFMDVAAPGLNIGLQIGDAVDDGHGKSVRGFECFVICSMRRRVCPTLPGRLTKTVMAG